MDTLSREVSPADQARRRDLRAAKRTATGLFVLIAALWAVVATATDTSGWAGYVRAALEASMVGALADWFAVTALFRHPLGLPIPHTAIIVERKNQFGRSLGAFVQENFLSAEVIGSRVRAGRYVERIARWVEEPANAATVGGHASEIAIGIVDVLRDEDVQPLLTEAVERAVQAVPLARVAGVALQTMTAEGRHEELLDTALETLERFLRENRDALKLRFSKESPWWLPGAVENRIFERMLDGALNLLHDATTNGEHELRGRINEWLADLAVRLQTPGELAERIEELKRELLHHEQLGRWTSSMWTELKVRLRAEVGDPRSELRQRLADTLALAGHRVLEDAELVDRIERAVESGARRLADRFRDELAELIAGTIARWDARETAYRLELLMGRDLQFIRINGTIVGGLAGLAIHTIAEVIGGRFG